MIPLTELEVGRTSMVVALEGGCRFEERLSTLGLRVGVPVTKVSSQLMQGPVTIKVGTTQVAIGYGMAGKVMVKGEGAHHERQPA